MTEKPIDKACGRCARRHVLATAHLECRAEPPVADPVSGVARWPRVPADGYCHSGFEPEAAAPRARRAPAAPEEGSLL